MRVTLCPSVRFSSTDTVNRAGNRHDRASIFCLVTRHDSYRSSLPLINKYAIGIAIRRACVDRAGTTHPENVSRCCRFARDAAFYGRWTSYFKVYTVFLSVSFCSILFHCLPIATNERVESEGYAQTIRSLVRLHVRFILSNTSENVLSRTNISSCRSTVNRITARVN